MSCSAMREISCRSLRQALLTSLAGLQILTFLGPGALAKKNESATIFDLAGQVAEGDNSKDTLMCETIFYSGLCDLWTKAYIGGKVADAEKIWSKILTKMKDSPSCYILVKKLYQRLESDAPENVTNTSKYGILPYANTLLAATEKAAGPNHRFVADILAFKATHYDSIKDYKAALPVRQRELAVELKATGPESEMTGFCMLDMTYELAELGRYDEGYKLAARVLKFARAHKYVRVVPLAEALESQLTAAMQRKAGPPH